MKNLIYFFCFLFLALAANILPYCYLLISFFTGHTLVGLFIANAVMVIAMFFCYTATHIGMQEKVENIFYALFYLNFTLAWINLLVLIPNYLTQPTASFFWWLLLIPLAVITFFVILSRVVAPLIPDRPIAQLLA